MHYLIVLYLSLASTLAKNLPLSNEVKSEYDTKWRIIGGEHALDGEYSYMVSIRYSHLPDCHVCGGSIIHEEWIIKAEIIEGYKSRFYFQISHQNHALFDSALPLGGFHFCKNLPLSNEVKIDWNTNWRIIGGEHAPDGEYPHMVSLRGIINNYHKCGGAIIHEEWVITAAHCLGLDPSKYVAVAGTNKLGESGDIYKLLEIHNHELYDDEVMLNDIAIVKVEKIKFTDKVNKIKLEKNFVGGDISVTLSGWGAIWPGGPQSDDLKHLTYNTTTVEECRKRMSGIRPIEDTQICTLHRAGIGGCHGDSGSPLIRSVDGIRYVVGTVSYGPECGSGYYPDVFQRVSSFVSWFNEKCNCDL